MQRFGLLVSTLFLLATACDDGDSGDTTAGTPGSTSSATPTTTGEPPPTSTTAPDTTTTGGPGTTTDVAGSSSGSAEVSSSDGGDDSTGDPNACNPQIPGEFNACIGDNGNVDNTLCNWTGVGGATGFIGCLTSSETEGANVCMISGCEDDCDCFAAPSSGDAPVECNEVLDGGGRACVLNCSDGQTCPDGMGCEGGLCFYLPE